MAGEYRIELAGELGTRLPWLKSLGCFTEIIAYKTRIFVPRGDRAREIISAVLAAV